ncbi:pentatricopeptide repeat-containing protein At2g33680 [Selaginella moellendorffii]|uniref:pentatricopeptide repeat-containing protein At2g33680 n=1 Tax=Selaginella moellendorffii TaxID=88036 RepID=UPI000D1C71F0|nr:pentatricopeptide repeat-containing protein At2g33680 [Selaginella moellendorffii]|eukprot:XP_024529813.1 pentatricopeptide repeat-containing protein At2g33680 [Selaginella moellendorffii]
MLGRSARRPRSSCYLHLSAGDFHESNTQDGGRLARSLRECARSRDLSRGKSLHRQITGSGMGSDRFLANLLMEMYGKCQDVGNADAVFRSMGDRNVFSWNIIIAANAQTGHGKKALHLFREMDLEGVKPSEVTFVSVISSVSELGSIDLAVYVRARVDACGFGAHLVVGTALIGMYGRCKRPGEAREIFDSLREKNVVSWTSMIRAYALSGQNREAVKLYKAMDVTPNEYTLASIAEACENLEEAREIETRAVDGGFGSVRAVALAIVGMFCKLGSLDDARRYLIRHDAKNVFCWNQLIAAQARSSSSSTAMDLYREMRRNHGVEPDCVTYLELLKVCSDWKLGRELHASVLEHGFEQDEVVSSALVTMHGRCAMPDAARKIFASIERKNVVSWTTMIAAYAQSDRSDEAMELFHAMDLEGVRPSEQTFVSVVHALASSSSSRDELAALAAARSLEERALGSGLGIDGVLGNAMVDLYGKRRRPDEARGVFDAMRSRSTVAWTAMIQAYAQSGRREEAFALFREMEIEPAATTFVSVLEACAGSSDLDAGREVHSAVVSRGLESEVFVGTALIDMFGKCGDCNAARSSFERIADKTIVPWNAMLAVYVQNGRPRDALELLNHGGTVNGRGGTVKLVNATRGTGGVTPDKITFVLLLNACGALGEIAVGRALHRDAIPGELLGESSCIGNALVAMYASCGSLEEARVAFRGIQRKSLASWNAMAGAVAALGGSRSWSASMELFSEMELQGFNADEASLAGILSGCSHAGLKHQGWRIFVSMSDDFGVPCSAVHYVCIVDMLGRLGQLDEAESLLGCMPYQPGLVGWMTLLGACGKHGDVCRGAIAARHAAELNDRNAAAKYVLLANMYAGIMYATEGGEF